MLSGGESLAQESVAGCEAISRFGDEHRLSRHALAHLKERPPKGLAAGLGAWQPCTHIVGKPVLGAHGAEKSRRGEVAEGCVPSRVEVQRLA